MLTHTEKKPIDFANDNIGKLLAKFAIPCIFSLLISALYNIVDQIFIGNSDVGYLGNAATSVVFPLTMLAMAFAWCFGDGAAAFMSLCQGRKDDVSSHIAVGNSILWSFITGCIFMLVCYLAKRPILFLFGASEQSIDLAETYFNIVMAVMPFFMIYNSINSTIRADGSPAYAMLSTLTGAILNIILDPIFIYVCKMGIAGAAWATIIGQLASFILSTCYFFRSKTFKLKLSSFKPNFKVFGKVLKLGVSTFITQISIVVTTLLYNIILKKYGAMSKYGEDIPIAVIGIVMKVFTIVINIVVGVIIGAQPIIGYNYGAQNYPRVRKTIIICLIISAAVGLISTVIFEACPDAVIALFGSESELYTEFARKAFRIFLMLVTFTCIIKLSSIFFQAIGSPVKATVCSLVRDTVCLVPLVIGLPVAMGIDGALWAAPISDGIAMIVTAVFLIQFFAELRKKEKKFIDIAYSV